MLLFLQAEDGIRDDKVTGVQTCALPIWFTVGSYELRHGMHVVFISVALANHLLIQKNPENTQASKSSGYSVFKGFKPSSTAIASITAAILGLSVYLDRKSVV